MILTGKEDLRVQKTISSIHQAFESMLIEMDFNKITIKELAERARINKKTFYRYYEDINDLLTEKQNIMTAECLQSISAYKLPGELSQMIQAQFLFFRSKGRLYEKIICCGPGVTGLDFSKVCSVTKEHCWDSSPQIMSLSEGNRNMLLGFIHRNVLAFYRDWHRSGEQEPLEQLSAKASALICGGVSGMLHGSEPF